MGSASRPSASSGLSGPDLAAGGEALARGAWEEARDAFLRALSREETPEALEGLGSAAWWLDDAAATFESRERAYRLYADRGERQAAARLAIAIAEDCLDFRGETAVANGWRERARRHLSGLGDVPERGWLAIWEGQYAILANNDPAGACRRAQEALDVARSLSLLDLEMVALALEGLALVSAGRVAEGMPRLDEATAAAVGGEMRDFVAIGASCCYLIWACERVRDFDRAAQWCERVKEFCRRWRLRSLFAVCRAHYAAVLMWKGAWPEAEAELLAASEELTAVRPAMAGEAAVRLAQLRRRQGRRAEAEALLGEVEGHALGLLVGAWLALDKGDAARAADLAERFLRGIAPEDRTDRLEGLEALTLALAALGRRREAREVVDTLKSLAEEIGTDSVRATARLAEGTLAAAQADLAGARRSLEDAVDLFRRGGAPFETARARLQLAASLLALGRRDEADREARLAREAFERLGAFDEKRRAAALLESWTSPQPAAPAPADPGGTLTAREVEVLRLVAQGLSNATIGEQLGVSEFTVKRHVANILTRLDLPSRAAAAAFAARHRLI
jgi:DNA-binding CsgD family transcriptional regulator